MTWRDWLAWIGFGFGPITWPLVMLVVFKPWRWDKPQLPRAIVHDNTRASAEAEGESE